MMRYPYQSKAENYNSRQSGCPRRGSFRQTIVRDARQATGRDSVPDMNWYFAYNFFRLAGIMQGIKKRVIDGTASSAHAKAMSERVLPLAEKAWDFARKAGA